MRKHITIEAGEDFLRQISEEVDFFDPKLQQEVDDLIEYTNSNPVFAMAAVQIGIPKRLVYIKSTDPTGKESKNCSILMINPKIVSQKGRTEYWEMCRSCLDFCSLVERPYEIQVDFQNFNGTRQTETFSGFVATILSHELDHLDGILHMDRAKKTIQLKYEQRFEFRKTHPYKILSKTCEFEHESARPERRI